MAFIPGFEYDIFISYAHVDNIAFPGQAEGWIELFYKNLSLMLAKRFGRMDMIKIWWDTKKLDGSILFDQSIEEGIQKSAVMICLNSPGYISSDYCKQELDAFYKKAGSESAGLKIADRSRIVHVLLNNIPFKEWPAELGGTTGFPFHDAGDTGNFGETLDNLSPDFRVQMQHLRDAVWNLLTDFCREETQCLAPEKEDPAKEEKPFSIYIAEVADTLRTPRKRIIAELEKKGFKVLTGVPPPDEVAAHDLAAKNALQNSSLSVHLMDDCPGREMQGLAEMYYPQQQAKLALAMAKPQMIWIPAETDFGQIEDEKYKAFLQELENGNASTKGYEFVRGASSALAQQIVDFADQLKAQQASKKVNKGKLSVLLDTHFNDQLYALDLSKALLENQVQPFINPQEDDPRKNINLLGERISQVRKLIFLYGSVSKEWVLERMSAALQLIIVNNYPVEDFFIYMAPPHKEAGDISIKQKFLKVNIFDSSNSLALDNVLLQRFLSDLKTEPA